MSALTTEVTAALFKAVGIALIGQIAGRLCKDAGENALSYVVELAARVGILAVSLPLLMKIMEFLEELVRL